MPASLRAHLSRGAASSSSSSSRPYDRRSPTASPVQSPVPPVHGGLLASVSLIQNQDPDPTPERDAGDVENTPPDHPGLPTYAKYKRIEAEYLHSLSPRKRDKALITQAMFDKIWDVLHQPEACTIETPQFRFWVRKMFALSRPVWVGVQGDGAWSDVRACGTMGGLDVDMVDIDSPSDAEETGHEFEHALGIHTDPSSTVLLSAVVLHENRPVAIMEQLYELFCYCHVRAGHGGRDKTCAVIRQHYSWVPKELTAQFVKACPTCALKRNGHGVGVGGLGVGVGVGVLVQKRAVGQREGGRERRGRGTPSGAEEMPVPVGWPTTGGPLDPGNPAPCGVRERAWLRAREEAVDPSNLPAGDSTTRFVPREVLLENCLSDSGGWNDGGPRAMTADAAPFRLCDTTNRPVTLAGTTSSLSAHDENVDTGSVRARTWSERGEKRRATKTVTGPGLPSLASALSDESLDENLNLTDPTGLGPDTAGECLPPALRPLRLSGPVPSETELDLPPPGLLPESPYPFQIDPVLLSFHYPGVPVASPESESGPAGSEPLLVTGFCPTRSRGASERDGAESECMAGRGVRRGDDAGARNAASESVSTRTIQERRRRRLASRCGSRRYDHRDASDNTHGHGIRHHVHCSADSNRRGQDLLDCEGTDRVLFDHVIA